MQAAPCGRQGDAGTEGVPGERPSAGPYLHPFGGRSALMLFQIALWGLLREREGPAAEPVAGLRTERPVQRWAGGQCVCSVPGWRQAVMHLGAEGRDPWFCRESTG